MTKAATLLKRKERPSSSQLLARILEMPDFAAEVQSLPAPVLAKLIDAVGLEDAGEIVAFASPAQLAEVFDRDIWRSEHAGGDERFDGDRFLVWLEVMMEAGESFVAERLASLPEDLVTLALHEHVLVLDLEELAAQMCGLDEDEGTSIEKALSDCLSEEIDRHQIIARRHDGWDTALAVVLALDRDHHALLARMLERLCAMTAEHVREGGLCSALTSEEMLEADVVADREDRRAALGYVAPADARAFLKLALQPTAKLPAEHDPVTRAYFRGLANDSRAAPLPRKGTTPPLRSRGTQEVASRAHRQDAARPLREGGASPDVRLPAGRQGGGVPLFAARNAKGYVGGAQLRPRIEGSGVRAAPRERPSALARVLLAAGVVAPPARTMPSLGAGACAQHEPILVRAMRALAEADAVAFAARSEEIAYLANVLVAGASIEGRRYRPAEAIQKVIGVCSRGLELASKTGDAIAVLKEHPADGLFRLAWSSGEQAATPSQGSTLDRSIESGDDGK